MYKRQEHGTLKEALLLFGDFRSGTHRRATLLPGPYQLDSNVAEPDVLEHEPQEYIYEPDAAIIRAGLVRQLAGQIGAMQLDAQIAYLSSNRLVRSPFARAWQTIRHGPFGLKELNVWLRDLNAGEVIIKKRGSPIEPDAFQRKLKTTVHGRRLTVFLTRVKAVSYTHLDVYKRQGFGSMTWGSMMPLRRCLGRVQARQPIGARRSSS